MIATRVAALPRTAGRDKMPRMVRQPVQYRNVRSGLNKRRTRLYPRGVAVLRSLLRPDTRLVWHGEARKLAETRTRGGYRVDGALNRYGVVYERTVQKLVRLEMLRRVPGEQRTFVITDAGRRMVRKYDLQAELHRVRCGGTTTDQPAADEIEPDPLTPRPLDYSTCERGKHFALAGSA